jgi:hypothetical protein
VGTDRDVVPAYFQHFTDSLLQDRHASNTVTAEREVSREMMQQMEDLDAGLPSGFTEILSRFNRSRHLCSAAHQETCDNYYRYMKSFARVMVKPYVRVFPDHVKGALQPRYIKADSALERHYVFLPATPLNMSLPSLSPEPARLRGVPVTYAQAQYEGWKYFPWLPS